MRYKIGTAQEANSLCSQLPPAVAEKLLRSISLIDAWYGSARDYLEVGGYSILIETSEDIAELKTIIDIDNHPCEWCSRIDENGEYLYAIYLMNDDFTITVFMPTAIAPDSIIKDLDLEEQK